MARRRAKRPLNKAAVKKANEAVRNKTTPPGRGLDPSSPADAELRKMWMDAYEAELDNKESAKGSSELSTPVVSCPLPKEDKCAEGREEKIKERKKRYKERKELIAKTKGNEKLNAAAERLDFNNDNIIRAEAAEHVYPIDEYNRGHRKFEDIPCPPAGLELIDPKDIPGLENAVFTDKDSGFGAALYRSEITGETMLVYRGTNNGVTTVADWKTNIGQGLGKETTQYTQAMELAQKVKQTSGGETIIVGHSLGGGLASAGSAATGNQAYTFNSAGLNKKTAKRFSNSTLSNEETGSLIKTTAVDGEILTGAQKNGNSWLTAALTRIGLGVGGLFGAGLGFLLGQALPDIPEAVGEMHHIPSVKGGNPVTRHLMPQVIDGIEFQKKEDIKTLKAGVQ